MAEIFAGGHLRFTNGAWRDDNGDSVEIAKVVRCKDCVCYEEQYPNFGYCYHWDHEQGMSPNQVDGDDFCSYGERRTDGR